MIRRAPPAPLATLLLLFAMTASTAAPTARADEASPAGDVPGVGRRVLALERAALRAPADRDVARDLEALRALAGVPVPPRRPLARATGWLSLDAWSVLGLAGLALVAVLVLQRGLQPALRRLGWRLRAPPRRAFAALVVAGALVFAAAVIAVGVHLPDATAAIVVDGPQPLRISPFSDADAAGSLPPGTKVHVRRRFRDFVEVEAGDARRGWIAAGTTEAVCPALAAPRLRGSARVTPEARDVAAVR